MRNRYYPRLLLLVFASGFITRFSQERTLPASEFGLNTNVTSRIEVFLVVFIADAALAISIRFWDSASSFVGCSELLTFGKARTTHPQP